jgi:scyllo-inositol 2-dehydrogenase (NADP+)
MGDSKISLAIIGAGRMGITHYSIINSHPDIKITAIADPSSLVLSIMEKYLPIATYNDYNDLLKKSRPDAVLVCTPPHLHYDILKKTAAQGIHAFVEKPFTTNYAHALEITNLYEKYQLINQVGYVNRFNDIFRYIKHLLDEDVLGQVIRFRSEMFSGTITKKDESSGWRASRQMGGGVVFEMASHAIDLVNFLLGKPENVVGTFMNRIYSAQVEDTVSTSFVYPSETRGTLYVNWSDESYRKPCNKIELFSQQGKILADQHSAKVFVTKPNEKFGFKKGWNNIYITDITENVPFYVRGNEFTRQLYHFVDCLKKKETSQCSFRDASMTNDIIEKIFKDATTNNIKIINNTKVVNNGKVINEII